ncbi:MAG: hypothetical protein WCB12_14960, partial [Bryobacteraceae bacterium]
VPAADRIQFPPAGQEVVIDDADDVKAVGHNARVGEVQVDQGAPENRFRRPKYNRASRIGIECRPAMHCAVPWSWCAALH